jgi:hypothetical protein
MGCFIARVEGETQDLIMRTAATPAGAHETFRVRLQRQSDGRVLATCDRPLCMVRAAGENEALAKIRAEIRYRIEWCPCTGVDDDYVQLEIERDVGGP